MYALSIWLLRASHPNPILFVVGYQYFCWDHSKFASDFPQLIGLSA